MLRSNLLNPRITFATAILVGVASLLHGAQTTHVAGPARWEAEIAKFEAEDMKSPPHADPIVFVGSSSIRLWKAADAFSDLPVINRGFGGSDIPAVTHFLPRIVTKYRPRAVVFYSGDNDIAAGRSGERVARDFDEFVQRVRKELPDAKLIVIGIKPSIKRWAMIEQMRDANRRIRATIQSTPGVVFIDVEPDMLGADGNPRAELFRDDGLHMNEQGYEVWNRLITPHIK
jgi:lysophospholipase L1-like esterase